MNKANTHKDEQEETTTTTTRMMKNKKPKQLSLSWQQSYNVMMPPDGDLCHWPKLDDETLMIPSATRTRTTTTTTSSTTIEMVSTSTSQPPPQQQPPPQLQQQLKRFLCTIAVGLSIFLIIETRAQQCAHMNDPNQGQNQGQPQAAPGQAPLVLPAPPQAQQAPPQPAAPLLPPPPAVPVAPPFALAPGCNNHILDWTNPAQTKQYYKATSPLDSTEKFDGQPNKIRLFLAHVEDQAQQFNWQSILTIPVSLPPMSYNLMRNYGQMSLQDVHAKALTYVRLQGHKAQDAYML